MKSLTLEQLVAIHSLLIENTGGSDGIRDIGRLESVIASQTQEVFGAELYQTVHEKAAALIRGVIADHPFVDGNKRTGMLAGLTFLDVNNVMINLEVKELEDFAVKVAVKNLSIEDIAAWLKSYTQNS